MFVQKLFKNQSHADSKVYVNMKSIDADVEQNGHSVIIIDDQADTTNGETEHVCTCIRRAFSSVHYKLEI
jgi:hypothetical protein